MDDLVYRLRKRAEIRRQISTRKSVAEGKPDRIADLLEEAADAFDSSKDRLIRIMGTFDLATGHADTMDQALDALESELRDVLGYLRARREWVGLTDEEIWEAERIATIRHQRHKYSIRGQQITPADNPQWHHAKAIEAKLKEKNT